MRSLVVMLALVLCACGRPPSDGAAIVTSITGLVLDADTNDPIGNALIVTEPFVKQAFTATDGRYAIEDGLTIGSDYRVSAEKAAYVTNFVNISNVVEGENTVADILLSVQGPELTLSATEVQVNSGSSGATFRISNSGNNSQPLTFSVSEVESWITTLAPASGSVTTTDQTVTVSIDRVQLPAGVGDVTGNVDVTTNGGSGSVVVRVLR